MTPLKAIRLKCLDCCCGSSYEVEQCPCEDCTLYPFRFGKNPFRKKRELTEEQRKELAERLAKNSPKFMWGKSENGSGV